MPSVQKLSESVGTSGYTAPEVIEGAYGLPADIFSFGILQWEALQPYGQRLENPLCGKDPEDTVYEVSTWILDCASYSWELCAQLSQGVRPPLDHCLVPAIHNMVEACWDTEPENRCVYKPTLTNRSPMTEIRGQTIRRRCGCSLRETGCVCRGRGSVGILPGF